ncbi:MAG TPA: zinc-ribbon and DUF3426 domain-containing protein [Usitatibacter sp.]|nr:zinc-ribbon and DUF3426 domain-containing protein [Usitatibacter sp.]
MLITTCKLCGARFRVTPQQLNAKQGQVRCGSCQGIFNGFESLERLPDDDTGSRLLAAREAAERAGQVESPPAMEDISGIETLENEPGEPAALPDPEPQPAPARAPRAQRQLRPDLTIPAPPRAKPPARAWRFGLALIVVVLAAEAAYAYRGPIAQRYPVLRPWLESACATVGCGVPWSREDALLKLEDSELLEVPGKPQEIALGARIRNLATVAQEYPHLELTLTDLTGQAAVRRVLRPTDYLGRPLDGTEVMAPGSEISVQLRLETPRTKATGYELLLFYP